MQGKFVQQTYLLSCVWCCLFTGRCSGQVWRGADLESDPLWLLSALLAAYKLDFLDLGQLTIDDLDSTPRESLNIEELSRSSC